MKDMNDEEITRLLNEIDALKKRNEELCALANEHARYESLINRRLEFEKTISSISSRFIAHPSIDKAIEESLEDMGRLRKAHRAYLFMFNEKGDRINNTHEWYTEGYEPQKEKFQDLPVDFFAMAMTKLRKGQPFHIKTASNLPQNSTREAMDDQGIKSLLFLPLKLENKLAGFIGFESTERTTDWTEDDISMLRVASEVIAQALERRTKEQELQKQMYNLSILYDVGKALNFIDDLSMLIAHILDRAIDIAGSTKGSLMLYNIETDELIVRLVRGLDKETEEKILNGEIQCKRIKRGEGIAGRVFASGSSIIINNTSEDPRFVDSMNTYATNILCIPLKVYQETIGVINITGKKDNGRFTENDLQTVTALANQVAIAINNAKLYELAVTDGLTKLMIRRHFMQRLDDEIKRSKRYNHKLALIMVDFDNFKEINDTYGHQAGDRVLMEVGKILRKAVRATDLVGRYGGEEFCIALPETGIEGAGLFCERLRRTIETTAFTCDNTSINKTISLGFAIYPDNSDNLNDLISKADLSLYKAKRDGRNKVCSFDEIVDYDKTYDE
ncbi:MAG: diguanylate cyclase [Candidatus Xenobiia bacterium LiM19]